MNVSLETTVVHFIFTATQITLTSFACRLHTEAAQQCIATRLENTIPTTRRQQTELYHDNCPINPVESRLYKQLEHIFLHTMVKTTPTSPNRKLI